MSRGRAFRGRHCSSTCSMAEILFWCFLAKLERNKSRTGVPLDAMSDLVKVLIMSRTQIGLFRSQFAVTAENR